MNYNDKLYCLKNYSVVFSNLQCSVRCVLELVLINSSVFSLYFEMAWMEQHANDAEL